MNSRTLLSKFPSFVKPSYETFVHNKAEKEYDIAVAVPIGKRAFIWFTFLENKNVCCIIEISRNQTLQDNIHMLNWSYPDKLALGTILSGYLVDGDELCPNHKYFVADDIFMYQGYHFGNPFPVSFDKKFQAFMEFFTKIEKKNNNYSILCIVMWNRAQSEQLPPTWNYKIGYNIKHIQYRSSYSILPFANYIVSKNPWAQSGPNIQEDTIDYVPRSTVWTDITKYRIQMPMWNVNFYTPVHRQKCLFWVKADISYDMYHLYVQKDVLYQYAFIPNYKTSVMMNKIFRKINENYNIDYIEESEDEDEFENIKDDKYVDLNKKVLMECIFNRKFKKWTPIEMKPDHLSRYVPFIEDFLHNTKSQSNVYGTSRHSTQSNQSRQERFPLSKCGQKKEVQGQKKYQQKKEDQYYQKKEDQFHQKKEGQYYQSQKVKNFQKKDR